jgi:formate-dependent nitrite reductase membrane component NrfD
MLQKISGVICILFGLASLVFSLFRPQHSPFSLYANLVNAFNIIVLGITIVWKKFLQVLPGPVLILLIILCSVLFFKDIKNLNLGNIFLYLAACGVLGEMMYIKFWRKSW